MTRKASLLFAILLVFQSITSGLGAAGITSAEGSQADVFKDVMLMDEEEKSIEKEHMKNGDNIWVHIDWSTEDVDVDAQDSYTMTLPEFVTIQEEQTGQLETGGDAIGTFYTLDSGDMVVEFAEEAVGYPDAAGTFVLEGVYAGQDSGAEGNEDANNENKLDEKSDTESDESEENAGEEADDSGDTSENESNDNDEDATIEEKSAEDDGASENETNAVQADDNDEKHGFKLELDEILDLDDEAFDEQHPMDPHKEFKLKLDWELEGGHNYEAGDTETFDLPKGIKIKKDIEIELTDENGQVIANAVVTPDKKVELTFTEFVEGHSSVSGWMEIISELDTNEVEEEDGEIIIDPIGEEGELRIPIEKENKDKTIEKNGTPDGYNADEIDWEVTVNKNKTSLKDAKVTDVLPEGTEYKDGSLKVTKLKVDLDGNVLGDGEEVEITPEVNEAGELIIPLGDTSDAYRVEYVTNVTDDEETNFKNNATITDEELDDVSAESTVTINRGEPLKKGAVKDYDPKTGIIEWYLEFNYNQKDLNDVTLEDNWKPAGKVDLVDGSLTFQEMTIDENGKATPNGDPVDPSEIGATENQIDDGFEVSEITTDKAYRVVYQTKVKDRELDGFRMENLASFEDNESGEGYEIGQFVGQKSAGNVDYAAKTIEWTIKVNGDHRQMNDVIIEDTIGEGLTLIDNSIEMTIGGQEYKDFDLENGNPFKLTNIDDTDKEIIVTYKTEFDADNVPDHIAKNKADITWTPEGEEDSVTKGVEAETELNDHTQNNDWKNGSYNPETKEITWEIIANYRENDIADLNIVDKPQGNQQIIDGSAEVKELKIAANGDISEGDTIGDAATIDEDSNTLEVALGETNKAYKITYKTSLAGLDDMQDEYVNEAEVLDGNEQISEIDAKVGIVKDSKYGDKSGYQDGKQVHWSIDVNLVQQKIKDLKLVDNISENQEYLEDSIKVYHANIDGNGKASKGEEVPSDEYDLVIDQDAGEFTVKWNNEVERAFIVEYSTLFFEKHDGEVRNDYTITGDSIEEEESDASGSGDVTIEQLGSGGGEGTAGYLVIDKVDTTDGQEETSLEGAEFDLIDADTENVLKSGTTDKNGQIDFGRLLFGDYILKETKVPEGYVTPEEEQTITIDEEYKPGDDKEGFEYTVENYVPVFAVELSKTDDEGNALKGAEFTLFDSDDNELQTKETDKDGKILFENLEEAGTYYVKETKAPAGYVLDETNHKVTIGQKEQKPIKVTAVNATRGNVVLTKTDVDTKEVLEGVEFELQKKNDSGEYEKVGDTFTTDKNGQIQTDNTLEAGNYQFVEVKPLEGYRTNEEPVQFEVDMNETKTQEYEMSNEQYKGSIKLIKTDDATEDILPGAEFKLVGADGATVVENLVTNEDGEIVVEDLFLGKYQLIETKAPDGYELDETPFDVEITKDEQVVEVDATNNQITNISVEKTWNNAGGDTEPITVKLLPTDQTVELNEDNDWKATFEDLYVYDESGEEVDYQVEELDVDGYNSSVDGDKDNGFIVTNTTTTSVSGTKTWKDQNDSARPDSITVNLLADGEKVTDVKVTADSKWEYEFTDLDKYDEQGDEIPYTIEEVKVDGYETTIEGFDITNLRVGKTEVEGTKEWKDQDDSARPDSITVNLLQNGKKIESKEVTAEDNWEYSFTNLPKYDENGIPWGYTVDEEPVEGYSKSVDGNDLINTRTGTTEVSGSKTWKDEGESDRPDSITVNLLQNGTVFATEEVTSDKNGDWKYSFTNLPKYDDEGKAYEYSVTEHDVPGYASEVDGFDITNTRTEKKDIEITKTWLDTEESAKRPESIKVELFRSVEDGEKESIRTYEVSGPADASNWSLTIEDLPAFDEDGNAYTYEIEEEAVDGYETTINGFDITNLRVGDPGVSGEKTWLDGESEQRPESIIVILYQNGEAIDEVDVTAEDNWKYSFTNLPSFDEKGAYYEYTVEEKPTQGYEALVDGYDIRNLRVGTTSVEGEKTWKNDEVSDRPESITVQLLANGEVVDAVKVTADSDWTYAFTDLEAYDAEGVEIQYSVDEKAVDGYETEINGYDITNTLITEDSTDSEKPGISKDEDKDDKDKEDEGTPEGSDDGDTLPESATDIFNLLLAGMAMIVLGAFVYFISRRRRSIE